MEMIMKHPVFRKCLLAISAGITTVAWFAFQPCLNAQENMGRGRVTGKVMDEKNVPVEGAKIVAQSLSPVKTVLEVQTNKKGSFTFNRLGTGMWRFIASKNGYQKAYEDINVRQLRRNPPVTLVLKDIASAVSEADPLKEATNALELGNRLLAEAKYAEAISLLEKFLSNHPEAYKVRLQIGMCWLKLGQLDKAERELNLLLKKILEKSGSYQKDPELAMQALAGLGEAAIKGNDIESGQKLFRQALKISPTNEILAYNVAEILFANQRTDEAIEYYLMAIEIKKEWPKLYHKLGLAYLNKSNFSKALEYLRKFIVLNPDGPAAAEVRNIIATVEKMK
jgi:tetratricopeptide (TPR) repeat protein